MKLLYLAQLLPYPVDAGPKRRIAHVLEYLVEYHQVTLLAFSRLGDDPQSIARLEALGVQVATVPIRRARWRDALYGLQSLIGPTPFLMRRDWVPAMARAVDQALATGHFDAVHADQLWMAPYALRARKDLGPTGTSPQLTLDQHNAVYLIPLRLAAGAGRLARALLALEARKLAAYERAVCSRFDHVVWVSDEDRRAVTGPRRAEHVIPICVDPQAAPPLVRQANAQRITFLGGLHWPPNASGIRWFAEQVFPAVRAQAPLARLTIIGKNPPAGLAGPGVEVLGYVADPVPYLRESAVFVVPLHAGGGMRVKILDAWTWGLPVVSTPVGAEGIACRDGHDLLLAGDPAGLAAAVLRVLREPELARMLSDNGRETVLEKYDWRTVYSAWDDIYPP